MPSAATSPSRMTTTRSARAASSMSWVIQMTVVPRSSRARATARTSSSRPRGSTIEVASSSTMTSASHASTPARATRCCWPPESACVSRRSKPASPTAARAADAASRASGSSAPKFSGPKATSSPTTEETNWFSGFWKTMPQARRSSQTRDGSPASIPVTRSSPSCRGMSAFRWRASVVFPEPFSPTIATSSPREMPSETPRSVARPLTYAWPMSHASTIFSPIPPPR